MYQMFFATSILHVHLMQWDDDKVVEQAVHKCNEIWESIESSKVSTDITLYFLSSVCNYYVEHPSLLHLSCIMTFCVFLDLF